MAILKYLILLIVLVFSAAAISPKNLLAHDSSFRTEKKHFKMINKRTPKGKKGKRFVLVQTAESATLEKNPAKPGSYQLVLHGINPYIQFYKAQPSKSFGIIFMRQYVWFCKIGRSAFLKCKRGALGYVSFVSSSVDAQSEVFELISPKYLKKENKLVYEIAPVDSFEIKESEMQQVTLIIDLALN